MKRKKRKPAGEEQVFTVDTANLDVEWTKQSKRAKRYADRLADAKLVMNNGKAEVDLAEAEVWLEIVSKPEKFGLKKTTEPVLKAAVRMDPRVQVAIENYNKARHAVDVLQGAVDAIKQKKDALENLVQLWSMSYFGTPKSSGAGREAVRQIERSKRPTIRGN